jgi:predicted dienelactone hydrolase
LRNCCLAIRFAQKYRRQTGNSPDHRQPEKQNKKAGTDTSTSIHKTPRSFSMKRPLSAVLSLCMPLVFMFVVAGCNPPATPPTEPEKTALDEPGAYKIGTYDTSFSNSRGNYNATVYYPATVAGANTAADPAGAPYPIVSVSPGLGSNKEWNVWIGKHLSTHGYIVMIFTVPNPLDPSTQLQQDGLLSGLDKLTSENASASSRIFGLADVSKRSVVGHSLGAMGSLSVAGRDGADLDAVVALAPGPVDTAALNNIDAPTQIQGASLDCITYPSAATTAYNNTGAANKQMFIITGGNHVGFNDEGSLAETGGDFLIDCDNTIDVTDAQQRLSRRFMTAWLDYFIKGEASVLPYISGAKAQAEVTAGRISDLHTQGL